MKAACNYGDNQNCQRLLYGWFCLLSFSVSYRVTSFWASASSDTYSRRLWLLTCIHCTKKSESWNKFRILNPTYEVQQKCNAIVCTLVKTFKVRLNSQISVSEILGPRWRMLQVAEHSAHHLQTLSLSYLLNINPLFSEEEETPFANLGTLLFATEHAIE